MISNLSSSELEIEKEKWRQAERARRKIEKQISKQEKRLAKLKRRNQGESGMALNWFDCFYFDKII